MLDTRVAYDIEDLAPATHLQQPMPSTPSIVLMLGARAVYDEEDPPPTSHANGTNEDATIIFTRDED